MFIAIQHQGHCESPFPKMKAFTFSDVFGNVLAIFWTDIVELLSGTGMLEAEAQLRNLIVCKLISQSMQNAENRLERMMFWHWHDSHVLFLTDSSISANAELSREVSAQDKIPQKMGLTR